MRRSVLIAEITPLLAELTRFARWLGGTPHEGDEIVQETLLRAVKAAPQIEDARALRAWLFRIARNAHVDLRRREAARSRFVVLEGGLDDLSAVEPDVPASFSSVDPLDLERQLALLPEPFRMALLLTDLWGFDHHEVARILDIPLGTVKSRAARARARIAAALASDVTPAHGRRA